MLCYKFAKDTFLSLNFRKHANYTISIPQCFIQYFIGVLGKKICWKTVFSYKKTSAWFFNHHSGWNLGKSDDVLSDFFFKKLWAGSICKQKH